ncbi:unnamed protein product, partial [Prorocentrum cordatum]
RFELMTAQANAQQLSDEMKEAWEVVDKHFDPEDILGSVVADVVSKHAVRASQHELPCAMSMMAGCISMANGGGVSAFPNSPSPLAMAVLNTNYPQTRKSAITAAVAMLGRAMDKIANERARAAMGPGAKQAHVPAKRSEEQGAPNPEPDGDDLAQTNHGTLLNLDEAYKMLRMLGMIADTGSQKGPLEVTDLASDFNRLFQTGVAAYATKTAGSSGQDAGASACLGVAGNAHPAITVPMERGGLGNHRVAVRGRWRILTAHVVEPRAPLPGDFVAPPGFHERSWPELMSTMAGPLGFPPGADIPEIAANTLPRARDAPHSDAVAHESQSGEEYLPGVEGYYVQLADGTQSRIRFKRVPGKWCPTFQVPNRDIPVFANMSMDSIAARVLDMFETPGIQLGLSTKGLLALHGFHAIFKAGCAQARNADRVSLSARLARESPKLALAPAAPGAGGPDGVAGEAPAGEEIPAAQGVPEEVDEGIRGPPYPDFIEDTRVARACNLFAVLDTIRSCWRPARDADTPEERIRRAEVAEEQARLQQ